MFSSTVAPTLAIPSRAHCVGSARMATMLNFSWSEAERVCQRALPPSAPGCHWKGTNPHLTPDPAQRAPALGPSHCGGTACLCSPFRLLCLESLRRRSPSVTSPECRRPGSAPSHVRPAGDHRVLPPCDSPCRGGRRVTPPVCWSTPPASSPQQRLGTNS